LCAAAFGWGFGHGYNSYNDDVVVVVREDCKDDKCRKKCDKCEECDMEMCDKCEKDDDKCYRKYFCDKCEKKVRRSAGLNCLVELIAELLNSQGAVRNSTVLAAAELGHVDASATAVHNS
jgi:hypothetical protein